MSAKLAIVIKNNKVTGSYFLLDITHESLNSLIHKMLDKMQEIRFKGTGSGI